MRIRHELDAFGADEIDAPIHDALVELHVRDAVGEQAADPIVTLIHRDAVPRSIELLGRREPRRAAADDGNLLAAPFRGRLGMNPAFFETFVDDCHLDVLDRDSRVGNAQDTGAFTGSRTNATGELREVVGLVQAIEGLAPAAPIDEVVPLGDQIVDRAAGRGLAKRDPAIHAARTLRSKLLLGHVDGELAPAVDSFQRVAVRNRFSRKLFEPSWLSHSLTPLPEGPEVEPHRARGRPPTGRLSSGELACSRSASP